MAELTEPRLEALLRSTLHGEVAGLPLSVRPEDVDRRARARRRERSRRRLSLMMLAAAMLVPVGLVVALGQPSRDDHLLGPRIRGVATRLVDGGVLVTGGWDADGGDLAAAELIDPSSGRSTATGAMSEPRSQHTATLLDDGRVLVVGSGGGDLYDPATGRFRRLDADIGDRYGHAATKLPDGRVLIIGGDRGTSDPGPLAVIFDPASEAFEALPATDDALDRMWLTLVPLDGHRVLVAGGAVPGRAWRHPQAAVYDLAAQRVQALPYSIETATHAADPREVVAAVRLPDGRVLTLVHPDHGDSDVLFTLDPATERSRLLAEIPMSDGGYPAPPLLLLDDGRVLVTVPGPAPGDGSGGPLRIFGLDPSSGQTELVARLDGLDETTLVALAGGGAMAIGGRQDDGTARDDLVLVG